MNTPVLLVLDLGTSGAKAAAVDIASGTIVHQTSSAYPTEVLPGGGSQQQPERWLQAAKNALSECGTVHSEIAGLSLTGQMQDLISLDESGRALGPAILYNDTRAHDEAAALASQLPDWEQLTGNEQTATSTAAMFARLGALADPRATDAATLLFSPAGYLIHRLGLGSVVDVTTASTTGLMAMHTRAWSPAICAVSGIDPAMLPSIGDGHIGDTGTSAAELLGLPTGIPVILAPGDAAATTAGIIGDAPGDDYLYLGSSGWHARVLGSGQRGQPGAVHQLALPDGRSLQIAAVLSAAATADWARQAFLGDVSAAAADRQLEHRNRRGFDGVLSLPSLQGERFPVRDDRLGAALVGMTSLHTPVDLYAGVLAGVALGLSHGMAADNHAPLPVVGGGARSIPWLEIIADVTGRQVRAVGDTDAALNGAALAGVDTLGFTSSGVTPLHHRATTVINPDPDAHESFVAVRARHRRLYDVLGAAD